MDREISIDDLLDDLLDGMRATLTSMKNRPRTPSERLKQEMELDETGVTAEFSSAIDGRACAGEKGCGGVDGILVLVGSGESVNHDYAVTPETRIMIATFDHHSGSQPVFMSAEQAKQLVNRLGEAISVAERVDAGTFTRGGN